jgi:inner membrane transporter RhtA
MTMTLQAAIAQSGPPDRDLRPSAAEARVARTFGRVPPTALLLLSILSVALGSALATFLFSSLGPAGTAMLSAGFAAIVLSLLRRPKLDRRLRQHALLILVFGLTDACMVLPFFLAIESIPLGIAATVTFLGPLGLAVATSRRLGHFLWIGVALAGILLLMPEIGTGLNPRGLALAALAAAAWAAFVPLSKRIGATFDGVDGLTFGLWMSTLMLLPFALAEGTILHAEGPELAGAFAVAMLTAVLPMAMEFRALQSMSARAYGILVTLEPAVSALVGAFLLGQALSGRAAIAIVCVTIAAIGITLLEKSSER